MKLYRVRECAAQPECPYTEYRLRLLIAAGKCPGLMIGNRFMIDLDSLIEQTRAEALANVRREA